MIISLLLKKALPFALTFVVGTALGGLTWLFGGSEKKSETVLVTRTYEYGSRCRMRYKLVAETKPLVIHFKPDARLPREFSDGDSDGGRRFIPRSALVRVTFGTDGRVHEVEPSYKTSFGLDRLPLGPEWQRAWENVERATRLIKFTPETRDGVPVSVTKELEIFFFRE